MKLLYIPLIASLASLAWAEVGDTVGCYSKVDTSNYKENGQYETATLCATKCGDDYPYVAIKNGGMCYCLSSKPTSNLVSSSKCSTPCNGYGSIMCGGTNAYTVFVGLGEDTSSSAGSLSLSLSSSLLLLLLLSLSLSLSLSLLTLSLTSVAGADSDNTSLSTVSFSSTSDAAAATTSASSSSTVSSSTGDATKTVTQSTKSSSTSSSSSSSSLNAKLTAASTNVGAIAGGVVGGVVGLIFISLAVFFFIRYKRKNDESDEEEFFEKGSGSGGVSRGNGTTKINKYNSAFDMPMANPFSDEFADKRLSKMTQNDLADPRLNPAIVGRRRLSDGSLADETDYLRKILAVANP